METEQLESTSRPPAPTRFHLAMGAAACIILVWVIGDFTAQQPITRLAELGVSMSLHPGPYSPAEGFVAHLRYSMTSHGAYAHLSIYRDSSPGDPAPPLENDRSTTPTEMHLVGNVDAKKLIAYSRYGPGLYDIWVGQPEISCLSAYLLPFQADSDSDTEFFVHQPSQGDSSHWYMGPGTYVIDYNRSAAQWEIRQHTGLSPWLAIRLNRWKLTAGVLVLWGVLDIRTGRPKRRTKSGLVDAR